MGDSMKLKLLVEKLSYNDLVKVCEKKGNWRIPTLDEVRGSEHRNVWILDDIGIMEYESSHSLIWSDDGVVIANINHKHKIVVVVDEKVCEWKKDEDGIYSTSCGDSFIFTSYGTALNGFKFCPYCGSTIKEIL